MPLLQHSPSLITKILILTIIILLVFLLYEKKNQVKGKAGYLAISQYDTFLELYITANNRTLD